MIIDGQNLHIFSKSHQTLDLQALETLVLDAILLFAPCAEDVKLEVLSSLWFVVLFRFFGYQCCSFVSGSLND